jgi:hypothetical protein
MAAELDEFIQRLTHRMLPNNPMSRVRVLAKELAEGAVEGLWGYGISTFRGEVNDLQVARYLQERWRDEMPNLGLLIGSGYAQETLDTFNKINGFRITEKAFDLVEEVEPADVFISYRRKDSSAFALLVLARLKAEGLNAFVDLSIQPGDNWQTHLKEQIQSRDYFVVLLGKDSLSSEVLHQELAWAVQAGANIMPIWHNTFVYRPEDWTQLPPEVARILSTTHTIRVLEESALAYNNAIVELLNRFGITP